MKNSALLIFILVMYHSFSFSRPQCLSCDWISCDCSRQNLSRVPAAPSHPITKLNLSSNTLKSIRKNEFAGFASLRSLILNHNKIRSIQDEAFNQLTLLEKLDLSFNRLDELSAGWFDKLLSLQHLNLLGNTYKTLGRGNLFQPLKRLKSLYFGGPFFESVRMGDFSGLSHLNDVVFDGQNLKQYTKGSLKQLGPIEHVTLGLNDPFFRNLALVQNVLADVVHPNTTLTFTETKFVNPDHMIPFNILSKGGTKKILFRNVSMNTVTCLELVKELSDSSVTIMTLEDVKIFPIFYFPRNDLDMKNLEEVVLKNVDILQFYGVPALLFLKPMLNGLHRISVVNCKVYAMPCVSSRYLSHLEFMDMSENYLTDLALSDFMCGGEVGIWNLQTLNVSRNYLSSINSQLYTKLENLENIDMSGNRFHSMPEICNWPPSLQFLNLSSNPLTRVTACLPGTLQILDLSHNYLTVFNIKLPLLKELYISGNRLISLPDGGLFPRLSFLSVKNNDLQEISANVMDNYDNLTSLEAGSNSYVCSCQFVAFMTSDVMNHPVKIEDEFKSYICESPDSERGLSVADAQLSVFECHTALAFSVLFFLILAVILLIVGLCYKFSVLWYLKMTWTWLRAKRKPKLKKGELDYDAFVSYSEMDSGWVDAHLIPELEQSEPRLRLCLHKRDFIPGGWILDNIMDAIERSHRTLFVLSRHFVQSEWCKYELDYTHFRLFDLNDDAVVLILLEPIDQKAIPKKFCKLRKVMNSRTYLEWLDDDNQIPRFWQSLRTAIRRPEVVDGKNEMTPL